MTPNENATFRLGARHAADMALAAALALEIRDDANYLRQRAAIAALQGLAEALKAPTGAVGANGGAGGIPPMGPPATFSADF